MKACFSFITMESIPTSKEFENKNKKETKKLKNNNSSTTCFRKIKPSYIIMLSIFSLLIITLIIFLCLITKKRKIKSAPSNTYYETLPDINTPTETSLEANNFNPIPDIKCLIENCKICEKDLDNNSCLECIPSYNPKYKNNKIISCDSEVIKDIDEPRMLYNNKSGENIKTIKNIELNNTKSISITNKSLK